MIVKLDEQINLVSSRCYDCGRFSAVEQHTGKDTRCPFCAQRDVEAARRGTAEAERVAAALRGALTRKKNAAKAHPDGTNEAQRLAALTAWTNGKKS